MSRGGSAGMSGANNIPLGRPGGQGGQLAQAASSLGGISLLNPSYLSGGAGPDPNERAASSSSSGRRSKFGPPVAGKKIFDLTPICKFYFQTYYDYDGDFSSNRHRCYANFIFVLNTC